MCSQDKQAALGGTLDCVVRPGLSNEVAGQLRTEGREWAIHRSKHHPTGRGSSVVFWVQEKARMHLCYLLYVGPGGRVGGLRLQEKAEAHRSRSSF